MTAVEWLTYKIEEQRENGNVDLRTTLFYCEQAKAMEKEQILEFTRNAVRKILDEDRTNPFNLEQYYEETYGDNK